MEKIVNLATNCLLFYPNMSNPERNRLFYYL
jgi:hypothetical protein